MANYYFPQLSSGTVAQYPFRKARVVRTITNALPSGEFIVGPDADGSRMVWQLGYSALSAQEANALSTFFNACQGRLRAFTFIDPAENMLTSSSDLSACELAEFELYSTYVQFVQILSEEMPLSSQRTMGKRAKNSRRRSTYQPTISIVFRFMRVVIRQHQLN